MNATSILEECLSWRQRAEHAIFLIKRSKVRKINQAFLPEGIQIEPGLLAALTE